MGLSAIRWQRFLSLNLLAAMLWAGCFIALGYFLGGAFRAILGDILHSFSLGLLAVFAGLALAVGLVHRLQKRRQLKVFLGPRAAPRP
jgi:membrane protein DedA with SNARE-associated domain